MGGDGDQALAPCSIYLLETLDVESLGKLEIMMIICVLVVLFAQIERRTTWLVHLVGSMGLGTRSCPHDLMGSVPWQA